MGSAPAELEVYELALDLERMPEEVRQTAREDIYWLKTVRAARGYAAAERARREQEKQEQRTAADKGQVAE